MNTRLALHLEKNGATAVVNGKDAIGSEKIALGTMGLMLAAMIADRARTGMGHLLPKDE